MSGLVGQVGARSGVVGSTTDSTQLDYEEGTFSPSINGASSVQYSTGVYVKIGRNVHFSYFSGSTTLTAVTASISGLPFTNGSALANYTAISCAHFTFTSVGRDGYIPAGGNDVFFVSGTTTTTYTAGSGKYAMISGTYQTA